MNAGRLALVLGLAVLACAIAYVAGSAWAPLAISGVLATLAALTLGRVDD
jgi:predicted PurR-regulated permease PerM